MVLRALERKCDSKNNYRLGGADCTEGEQEHSSFENSTPKIICEWSQSSVLPGDIEIEFEKFYRVGKNCDQEAFLLAFFGYRLVSCSSNSSSGHKS